MEPTKPYNTIYGLTKQEAQEYDDCNRYGATMAELEGGL
jgi:hypothetical protein